MSDTPATTDLPVTKRSKCFWLRIAVSVFFGLLTVVLCMLWPRSFFYRDQLEIASSIRVTHLSSDSGVVSFGTIVSPVPNRKEFLEEASLGRFYSSVRLPEGWESTLKVFKFRLGSITTVLPIPHWYAVLLLAALSAVPWLSWSNPPSRRALILIASALIAS